MRFPGWGRPISRPRRMWGHDLSGSFQDIGLLPARLEAADRDFSLEDAFSAAPIGERGAAAARPLVLGPRARRCAAWRGPSFPGRDG